MQLRAGRTKVTKPLFLLQPAPEMLSAVELMAISFGQRDSLWVFEPDYIWVYDVLNATCTWQEAS